MINKFEELKQKKHNKEFFLQFLNLSYAVVFNFSATTGSKEINLLEELLEGLYNEASFARIENEMLALPGSEAAPCEIVYITVYVMKWRKIKQLTSDLFELVDELKERSSKVVELANWLYTTRFFKQVKGNSICFIDQDTLSPDTQKLLICLEEMEPLAQDATTIKRVIAHVKENGVLPKEYCRPEIEHLITMYYFDAITLPNKNWVYRKWYHFKELLTDTIYNIRDSSWWYNFVQAITFKNALMVVLILLLAGAVLVIRKLKKNHEEEWKTLAKTVNELNNFESRSNNLYDSLHKIDNRNTVTALYSPMIGIKCYLAIVRTDSVGFKNPQSITNKLYQAVRKVTGNALCSRINLVVLNRDVDTMFFTQDFYFKGNKLIRECSGYKPIECDLLEINYVTPIE